MFYVRAPTQEPRWGNKFQKLCSCLRDLLPPGFCRCLVSCLFCVVAFSAVLGLCSFLLASPSMGADPKKPSTLEGNPPKFVRGDGVRGYLHWWKRLDGKCFLRSTIPLSFLAFVHYRFRVLGFPPACSGTETILQLVVIRFPSSFGTSRHHVLFSTEPERSPSQLFSSASLYRFSLAMAVAVAVRDRHCGVFRHADMCSS